MKAIVVVPTIREECIREFLKAWETEFASHGVFVVEDNPEATFDISSDNVKHFSWQDIDRDLGENAWIIPRRTDCVRSYGYFKAWEAGADVIITLDDDCYPLRAGFVSEHLSAVTGDGADDAWASTGEGLVPRGMPYFNRSRKWPCMLNHGLWSNVPDYDAATQMVSSRLDLKFEPVEQTVPAGRYFPMCGMNVAFRRELAPAMYFMLMGRDYEYDRFGDIWAGIMAKKVCDHLGFAVKSGKPIIEHRRASNVWANLRKEVPGLPVNEELWEKVDAVKLNQGTAKECYREIAQSLEMSGEYWSKLKPAMTIWAELF